MKHFVGIAFWKQCLRFCIFLLGQSAILAQNIPVGTWRTHFSYNNAKILTVTSDKVFCAVENGLFSVDINEGSVRKLSKIDGLSDVKVSAMAYYADETLLVIGYESGLIDFVFEDRIETVKGIFNSGLEGDKRINSIAFYAGETFVATSLGIVVIPNDNVVIKETLAQIGPEGSEVKVFELVFFNNLLFAKTNQGIQQGNLSENLLDFNNWLHYEGTASFKGITALGDQLFAITGTDLFELVGENWVDTEVDLPEEASEIFSANNQLLTASDQSVYEQQSTGFEALLSIDASSINDITYFDEKYWLADSINGLFTSLGESLSPAGPLNDTFSKIKVQDEVTFGFHAPDPSSYDGALQIDGFSSFQNDQWSIKSIDEFKNISDVAIFQGNRYFGSIGDGFYDETNGRIYDELPSSNSGLSSDTIITAVESNEGLWVIAYDNDLPMHQFTGEEWTAVSAATLLSNQFEQLDIAATGIVWLKDDESVTVYDPVETLAQRLGDTQGIPGPINDMVISVEDNAWLATAEGPVTFTDASFVFDFNEAIQPIFENRVLFEEENINAVQTDGGNRIWFGTDRGLWLFDENISEQIAFYDISNSPIPSNSVLDLAYNATNGELFIYTDKGLVSFRTASSIGQATHQNVNIFPNPVRPGYDGLVGIERLANNVSIKITDINGQLVKEVEASGGATSWDLTNLTNAKVVTGIYLVFSATDDGQETYVGKIAVIR